MLKSLYDLSADPPTALASLLERYGKTSEQRPILGDVEKLLADVGVRPAVTDNIAGVYHEPRSARYPAIRGPLGLYLFLDLVTTASLREVIPTSAYHDANAVLRDPAVKDGLKTLYRLGDDCDLGSADLYRIGTTSLIIDCEQRPPSRSGGAERRALKCVLPRHFSVRAIKDSTEGSAKRHKALLKIAPKVYYANDRAVLMEFIEGQTLAERFAQDYVPEQPDDPKGEKRAKLRALRSGDIEFIRELGRVLCEVLGELSVDGQSHLDLSPRNVILVREKPFTIRLIDFGRNFAIAEGVASSVALARAAVYVEPQMIARRRSGDWRSDCYSLGMILLEAAARQPLRRETITSELWRLWTGEHPWDGAPGLARIIEDLIDADPRQRLVFMPDEGAEGAFAGYRDGR